MFVRFVVCSAGVYATFLLWALAQESLSAQFNAPLVLQLVQSIFAAIAASRSRPTSLLPDKRLLLVALTVTLSPVFAFASLAHISYPTMVLAKSCKLIPTILTQLFVYRLPIKPYKYFVVLALTLGISIFFYKPSTTTSSSSSLGLLYLLINLFLDGLTNSTQDAIFAAHPSLSGQQMMFSLSILSASLSFILLILPIPYTTNLSDAILQIYSNPSNILPPLLQYALTNAIGQLFIFETLHHFGSLTLITLTLTRKLFSILLSVFIYNHHLSSQQWVGTAIVFAAISFEAAIKRTSQKQKLN